MRGAARAAHTQTGRNLFCSGLARSRRSRERRAGLAPAPPTDPQILRGYSAVGAPGPRARPAGGAGGEVQASRARPRSPLAVQQSAGVPLGRRARPRPGVGGEGVEQGRVPRTPAAGAGVAPRDPAVGTRRRRRYLP